MERIVSCLNDSGYPVAAPKPGQYVWTKPQGVDARGYSWANYDCWMKVGSYPEPRLSDANLTIMYERDLAVAECLRKGGVQVPEAPTYQTYAARWRSGDPTPWFPTMLFASDDPRYDNLMAACDGETLQPRPFVP